MDELAYSLNGENAHYGTPPNPACPDRLPGGSSSGSASAVAAGTVDFALGSDTGGAWWAAPLLDTCWQACDMTHLLQGACDMTPLLAGECDMTNVLLLAPAGRGI